MKTKGKATAIRLSLENDAWILGKAKGKRGAVSVLVDLAVTEMRHGMESKPKGKAK